MVSWHYWYCSSCSCYYLASLYFFSPKVLSSSSQVVSWHYALAHCHKSLPALPPLPRCQDPRTYLQHISKRMWSNFHNMLKSIQYLSSWRSFGLRAESARAVTGRQCPNSRVREDVGRFSTKTVVTRKRKVEVQSQGAKWTVFPRATLPLTKFGVL